MRSCPRHAAAPARRTRAATVGLALLTATSTLGGECQEYLDSVEAEERRRLEAIEAQRLQAVQGRLAEALPRRKLLVERLQLQLRRMEAAEARFIRALPEARARLRPQPSEDSCAWAPRPRGEDGALLLQAPAGAPLPDRAPPGISQAQRDLAESLTELQTAPKPATTLAEYQRQESYLARAEERARSALDRGPEWVWVVAVERRQPAELRTVGQDLEYTPGTATGVAYLYQVAAGQFVCLAQFSAKNTPKLPLLSTRIESTSEYDYRSGRYRSGSKTVHSPLSLPDAAEKLRQDLDRSLWSEVTRTALRAELAPAPAPSSRRRGK